MKADSKHHSLCSIKVRLFANSQCLSTALEHNQLFYVHQWHDGILGYNAASAPNVSLHYSYNQSLYELLFNALFNYCIYPIHPITAIGSWRSGSILIICGCRPVFTLVYQPPSSRNSNQHLHRH